MIESIGKTYAVIGPLSFWEGLIPTKFRKFERPFIHGLAFVNESSNEIEILAVGSTLQGQGYFRIFLDALKASYNRVRFWSCTDEMQQTLMRHGFLSGSDSDEFGQITQCCDWIKK